MNGEPTTQVITPRPVPCRPAQNPAEVYLAGLGEGSRRTMRQALDSVAGIISNGQADALDLPWEEFRFRHTSAIQAALADRYRPATANKILSALRGVLRAACRLGLMDQGTFERASNVRNIPGESGAGGRFLTEEDIAGLLRACARDPGPAGSRDAAIIGLMYSAGARSSETVALDLSDLDLDTGSLKVRGASQSQERCLHPAAGALDALRKWLEVRGNEPGPLFCRVGKGAGGLATLVRVSSQAIYKLLHRRAGQAGGGRISARDVRRTFVENLLSAGMDIATVQQMAGHAARSTTSRYGRRSQRAHREPQERPGRQTDANRVSRPRENTSWRAW